jgi:TetR/AcrR family transcriptional regulator, transcriptional repressor of bet genes
MHCMVKGPRMPKQVDHAVRRQGLLDALWRITRREGWDAISLRKVAAEAGVSMGLVQHYFTTKDEMLRFAIEEMAQDTRVRIRARLAELTVPPSPQELVELVLVEMIPRTSRRQDEAEAAKVWLRRVDLRPESRGVLSHGAHDVKTALVQQIQLATSADADTAAREASTLMALLDGLIFNIVAGLETTESATAIVRAQIARVFASQVSP